ncbi:MAG: hypothetical protein AAGJ39_12575, partial [Pseudomonadota bacterium]
MNPLLLLLLGFGGFMAYASTNDDDTETVSEDATSEDPVDDPVDDPADAPIEDPADAPVEEPADAPVEEPADDPVEEPVEDPVDDEEEQPAFAGLTMVIWDMENAETVEIVEDGETIDLGTAPVEDYTFAAEMADGSTIGSMLLEYQGQTWLQNIYPYTLEDSPIDLAEGDFDVTVTAYSGANATGDVLGTQTISFSTTSQEPVEEPV